MDKRRNLEQRIVRNAHHLWAADEDESGVRVRRNRQEPEMFSGETRTASLSKKIASERCVACLGLIGADLVDDPTLNSDLPKGIVGRFNTASRSDEAPRIYEWAELRRAFGADAVDHVRRSIGGGMKIRLASKYLGLPFLVTAEILDQLPSIPQERVAAAVQYLKSTPANKRSASKMGAVETRIAAIFEDYKASGSHKLAVDEKAAAYWESYYGPFGKELVREVHKRVRADLADIWLRKNGVDEAAAAYWKKYFGEYGDKWVSIVPKKLSPSNAKK